MNVTLDIALRSGNAAFEDCPSFETARILRKVADDIEASSMYCADNLWDVNGNRVGSFSFEVEDHNEDEE